MLQVMCTFSAELRVDQLLHVRFNSTFVQNETFWLKCRVCTVDTVARVAFCSAPAARLCAAWELGFSRTRTESAERKTSCCCVIGFIQVHSSAPQLGAVLGNSQAPGPCVALDWARGPRGLRGPWLHGRVSLDSRVRPFRRRRVRLRRLPRAP